MNWYVETPAEAARHDPHDREDVPGIEYLRHVRGMALDQIDCLYDHNVVNELAALYVERVVKRHLGAFPQFAEAADALATFFRNRDTSHPSANSILRFICSGLVQYSFFEALRRRIIHDLTIPEHRDAAMSNLNNMHRIIFHPDPEGVIDAYIQQVKSGKVDIHTPVPQQVLDLIKTTTPSDFNNSSMLEWCYIIRRGVVWKIEEAPADYKPQSEDEEKALELLAPEHSSFQH